MIGAVYLRNGHILFLVSSVFERGVLNAVTGNHGVALPGNPTNGRKSTKQLHTIYRRKRSTRGNTPVDTRCWLADWPTD